MRRRSPWALLAAALVALAAAAPPAAAAPQTVRATFSNVFSPSRVAVKPLEKVTFVNDGGQHNVVWNDNGVPPSPPDSIDPPWPAEVSRTFNRNGRYRYYCALHAGPTGDFGMVGYVYVNAAGALPPTLSALTASATRTGVRVGFRASAAGRARATFFRRRGGVYVRQWASTLTARRGLNSRRVARALAVGSYRVDVVLTDARGLRSEKRTRTFRVR